MARSAQDCAEEMLHSLQCLVRGCRKKGYSFASPGALLTHCRRYHKGHAQPLQDAIDRARKARRHAGRGTPSPEVKRSQTDRAQQPPREAADGPPRKAPRQLPQEVEERPRKAQRQAASSSVSPGAGQPKASSSASPGAGQPKASPQPASPRTENRPTARRSSWAADALAPVKVKQEASEDRAKQRNPKPPPVSSVAVARSLMPPGELPPQAPQPQHQVVSEAEIKSVCHFLDLDMKCDGGLTMLQLIATLTVPELDAHWIARFTEMHQNYLVRAVVSHRINLHRSKTHAAGQPYPPSVT